MRLQNIKEIKATIIIKSGLHIGGSKDEIKIGGIDNPVVKNPITGEPYIPGSSLKGKIRTMLEWWLGTIDNIDKGGPTKVNEKDGNSDKWKNNITENHKIIAKIFGNGGTIKNENIAKEIGPTRVSFYDCFLTKDSANRLRSANALTEAKTEVVIDRFSGTAKNGGLRQMERVPAEAEFEFKLSFMIFDETDRKNFKYLALGMKLLELVGIGGSTSRGYGKIKFFDLEGLDDDFVDDDKKLKDLETIKNGLENGNNQNYSNS